VILAHNHPSGVDSHTPRPEIRSKFSSNNAKARKRSSVVREKMGVIDT
jgi:hypothetical protein